MAAKLGSLSGLGTGNYSAAPDWIASNAFSINVESLVQPVFSVPGYDNSPVYNVGDPITLSPQLSVAGSPSPSFTVSAGALPSGVSLNASTGIVSGTLSSADSYAFDVTATNSEGSSTTTVTFSVLAVGDFGFNLTDCRAPDQTALGDRSVSYKIYDISDNSFIAAGTAASVSSAIEITDAAITQAGVNYELTITVDGQTWSLNFPSIASVEIV